MLRGAIEAISENSVTGWIHAAEGNLRGRPILAFVDESCVGAGQVSLYRKDLADAGLGDGFLGFHFPIALPPSTDSARVVVRLEGSDAALLPAGSRVVGHAPTAPLVPHKPAFLRWMRDRGWLDQPEYDFLAFLDQFGVYDRSLVAPKRLGMPRKPDDDPETVARELLELHYMAPITLREQRVEAISALPEVLACLTAPVGEDLIVALHATERTQLAVVEASHRMKGAADLASKSPIEHALASNRLLLLNAACAFEPRGIAPSEGIRVWFAVAEDSAS